MLDLPVIQKSVDVAGHMTFVCIGALVCMMLAWAMQIRVAGFWKAGLLSLTEILLGEALGLFFAKVVYFLVRFNYLTELGTWRFFMFSFSAKVVSFLLRLSMMPGSSLSRIWAEPVQSMV